MDVLILGGTRFLGIHITHELLRRGHAVTLFNTGRHPENVPAGVEQIPGDRMRDLTRLGTRFFDAVIDTCGYTPGQLEISARHFADRTRHYTFVSSISAQDLTVAEVTEDTAVLPMPEGASRAEMTPQTYGPLKALCENVTVSTFRHRALIVRPGLIAGPHDPTDRFTYWPVRIARGGRVLAPVGPQYPVQFIDARDLANWIVKQAEASRGGTFDVTGRANTLTLGDVLSTAACVANTRPHVEWADEAFLERHEVGEWVQMPLWISHKSGLPGMRNVNVRRALAAGLKIRPLRETVRDTLGWARRKRDPLGAGLDAAREAALLEALTG